MTFAERSMVETARIATAPDYERIESLARLMREVRDAGGRVFFIGVGGGAGVPAIASLLRSRTAA